MNKKTKIIFYGLAYAVLCVAVFSYSYIATVATLGSGMIESPQAPTTTEPLRKEPSGNKPNRICLNITYHARANSWSGHLFDQSATIIAQSEVYDTAEGVQAWAESQGFTIARTFYYSGYQLTTN